MNYLVATVKSWNIDAYEKYTPQLDGDWFLVSNNEELTMECVKEINPRYIFFPHWSWIVPSEITDNYECVCFHMTDVPYGRGGSPLQNLIIRGHKETQITALKMTPELDAGDIYQQEPLELLGSAQEIFTTAASKIYKIVQEIIQNNPTPESQVGDVTLFERRVSEQSEIPKGLSIGVMYDYIRMLDAETYPRAYIDYGGVRLLFDRATLVKGKLTARVEIEKVDHE